jgi:type I restriction enzyme S subunit
MTEIAVSLHPEELKCIKAIFKNIIPDREVWAFGSRTSAHHKPFSDLDVVVMGENPLPIEKLADLHNALSESDLTFKVDVVVWSELTENFKNIIENHHVVIKPIQSL